MGVYWYEEIVIEWLNLVKVKVEDVFDDVILVIFLVLVDEWLVYCVCIGFYIKVEVEIVC